MARNSWICFSSLPLTKDASLMVLADASLMPPALAGSVHTPVLAKFGLFALTLASASCVCWTLSASALALAASAVISSRCGDVALAASASHASQALAVCSRDAPASLLFFLPLDWSVS